MTAIKQLTKGSPVFQSVSVAHTHTHARAEGFPLGIADGSKPSLRWFKSACLLWVVVSALIFGCKKVDDVDVDDHGLTVESLDSYRELSRLYTNSELIQLADDVLELSANSNFKSASYLLPEEVMLGVETFVNRELQAGRRSLDTLRSNVVYFPFEVNVGGGVDASVQIHLSNMVFSLVDSLNNLGKKFYMLDVELHPVENIFIVDVLTVLTFYQGTGFGFQYFDESETYYPFSPSFRANVNNSVNNRLFFQAIEEGQFITDITPSPSLSPEGVVLSALQVVGVFNGCAVHNGTVEQYGGPHLVLGGANEWEPYSGAELNVFMERGLDYFNNHSMMQPGFQLVRLDFRMWEYAEYNGPSSCIGYSCSQMYPCYRYYHHWRSGRYGRILSTAK